MAVGPQRQCESSTKLCLQTLAVCALSHIGAAREAVSDAGPPGVAGRAAASGTRQERPPVRRLLDGRRMVQINTLCALPY